MDDKASLWVCEKIGSDDDGNDVKSIKVVSSLDWSRDVLRLCEEYKDRGVVGIDLEGDEFSSGGET